MRWPNFALSPRDTPLTLAVGAAGALLFWWLNAPVYMLLGPVIAVSVLSLAGVRTGVDARLRDACFIVLGLTVGAGFNHDAVNAMVRWPLAFVFMTGVIWAIMAICRWMLARFFGFDRRSALLASAPGHLSFVMAVASYSGSDVARISITQSVRLLALTIVVPFVAMLMGVDMTGQITPVGAGIGPFAMLLLMALAVLVGLAFKRFSVPAPLLMGAMVVSAMAHLTQIETGVLPQWLTFTAYLVLGSLIGSRFSGMTLARLRSGLGAGLAITGVAVGLAGLGAVPVAWALGMPLGHVLVAFAPGGLETMIALGAVLAVVPGFVAACHIMRLVVLSVLLPAMLARVARREERPAE
ncbi:AbrB family transcriptional regulator [Sulfitobacter sp. S0837]|uniref:AbrB family transcriptional regulator n=1 Tax=Sulfitobacter maritimus TaxID=2741719 RepID=UPI0015834F5B|nr:AbrB family transcriptional regulator [Sulfitobacter maritimus]NUH64409.1 AbrB family transcriptional regulator [Sulfitobacter maritimus]